MDKETLSNYGWIVICVLVLAVMIALATPFGDYISTAVKSTTQGLFDTNKNALNSTGLINIGDQSFSDGTDVSAGTLIPDGATYTTNGGTALVGDGTNTFPETPADGDEYTEGDYTYKYNYYYSYSYSSWYSNPSQNGWGVRVKDTTKAKYGTILSEISGQPANTMSCTFSKCTSLTTAPTIPNSVTNMEGTFLGCTSLTTAPVIPSSVTNMQSTFYNCTKLTTPPDMSNASSVTDMSYTFRNCTALTTAPTIPNSVTKMNNTFSGCTSLTTAPTIPNSVTSMNYTFSGCSSLTGTIEVNANPTFYDDCFLGTSITDITGSCSQETKDALMATK